MDLKQLHYFTEIVKQGNITKAAEVLHIAQPPLSQALKKLERELNTTLIERYRSKWTVTESGRFLFEQAEQMSIQMEYIKRKISEIETGEAGILSIGISIACAQMTVPVIEKYKKDNPEVFFNIKFGDSKQLEKMLAQDEIEFAIIIRPEYNNQYAFITLKEVPLMALLPSDWCTDCGVEISLTQLEQYPFIMMGKMEGFSVNERILDEFQKNQLHPNIEFECRDIGLVQALVKRKLGFAIIPEMDLDGSEGVKMLKIKEFQLFVQPVVIHKKERLLNKKAAHFSTYLL